MGSAAATVAGAGLSYLASENQADAADARMGRADAFAARRAQIADEQWERYKEVFAPAEEEMVEEADFSPAERRQRIGEAGQEVTSAFNNQRGRMRRRIGRYGIDPTSGRHQGAMSDLDRSEAASRAGTRNEERRRLDDLSFNRKSRAVGLGKGLPTQASSGYAGAASSMRRSADRYADAAGQTANFVAGLPWQRVSEEISGWFGGSGGS